MSAALLFVLLAGPHPGPLAIAVPPATQACVSGKPGRVAADGQPAGPGLATGRLLLETGAFDEAVVNLECAVELEPDNVEAWHLLGDAYVRTGRWWEALEQYEHALGLDPQNERVWLASAGLFLDSGLPDEADETLTSAVRMFPESILPDYNLFYFRLAELYFDAGRFGDARRAMVAAASHDGPIDRVTTDRRLGDFLTELIEFDAAYDAYSRALEIRPDDVATRLSLGGLYLQQGRAADALEEFRRVLELEPDVVGARKARNGLAEAYFQNGQLPEAIAEARQAIAIDPEAEAPHYVLGRALQLVGQSAEARDELDVYRRLQNQALEADHRAQDIHAYQSDAITRFYRGDADGALRVLEQGTATYPRAPDLQFSLGLVLSQLGRHADAVEVYLNLLDLSPESAPTIHRHLARELGLAGDAAGAEHHAILAAGTGSGPVTPE